MNQTSVVEIRDVSVFYGGTPALEDVTFGFEPGVTALLGENGAGKTTLMRVLSGILKPSGGALIHQGAAVRTRGEWSSYGRQVGYMPQAVPAVRHLKAREYLEYLGFLKGLDRSSTKGQVEDLLTRVGLGDRMAMTTTKLSGGMRRRLGLAAALLGDPSVLLLDEPTVGLDPAQRVAMRELVRGEARERTVLVSTHLAEDVAAFADRVVVLHGGRVVFADLLAKMADDGGDRVEARDVERAFAELVGRPR